MKSIYVGLLLIVLVADSYAQDKTGFEKGGSKALLFSFNGLDNISLDDYNGGAGFKVYFGPSLALRAGLRLNGLSRTDPVELDYDEDGVDGEYSEMIFGWSVGLEWHLKKGRVNPFVGGGLDFNYGTSEQKEKVKWNEATSQIITRDIIKTNSGFGFGIFGVFGLEIFIIKNLSVSAEYQVYFDHLPGGETEYRVEAIRGTSPNLPHSETTENISSNRYGIGSSGLLTMAVYF